jgi:hypothetical protein
MLKLDKETHTYTLNGKELPSVTQIPSRLGIRESDGDYFSSLSGVEHIVGKEKSSKFGDAFHEVCKLTVLGKQADYDPNLQPWVDGLNNFLEDENLNAVIEGRKYASIYQVERSGYSDLGFAGSWDWFFYFEIRNTKTKLDFPRCLLIDWKSSTGANKKMNRMQTAAYRKMVVERNNLRNNINIPRWTVQFDPGFKRGYKVDKRSEKDQMDWILFQSCLNVYKNFI